MRKLMLIMVTQRPLAQCTNALVLAGGLFLLLRISESVDKWIKCDVKIRFCVLAFSSRCFSLLRSCALMITFLDEKRPRRGRSDSTFAFLLSVLFCTRKKPRGERQSVSESSSAASLALSSFLITNTCALYVHNTQRGKQNICRGRQTRHQTKQSWWRPELE